MADDVFIPIRCYVRWVVFDVDVRVHGKRHERLRKSSDELRVVVGRRDASVNWSKQAKKNRKRKKSILVKVICHIIAVKPWRDGKDTLAKCMYTCPGEYVSYALTLNDRPENASNR